jgi:CelD/BcsL family acetyltransferase involved in cellulose biosynthesis
MIQRTQTSKASPDLAATKAAVRFTAEVITQPDAWRSLEEHWDCLLKQSESFSPWQSWSYLSTWWRHLAGANQQLRIIVVRDASSTPRLILPLQLTHGRMLRIPLRFIEPIGMLHDVNRPRLALGTNDPTAYACAFECIERMRDEWDVLRIDEKRLDDWELARLREYALNRGLALRLAPSFLCPWLDLRQSWESFLKSRGTKLGKNLRAARRKLEARGAVAVRTYEGPHDIDDAVQQVLDIHRRSWKAVKKIGLAQSGAHECFYVELTRAMAQHGHCRIHLLYSGERAIAGTIAFMDESHYYSAEIAHDDDYSACSPGTLLEAAELQNLMQEQRFIRYDFMGGALNNKMRWTDQRDDTYRVLLLRPSLRTWLTDLYYFRLKPLALHYFPRLRRDSVTRELSAAVSRDA